VELESIYAKNLTKLATKLSKITSSGIGYVVDTDLVSLL